MRFVQNVSPFVLIALLSAVAFAQTTIPEWVKQENRKWYAAFNAADAPALSRLYAEDAVSMTASRVLRGREEIESFHRGNFEKALPACKWVLEGAHVLNRQAAVWGTDTCTETPKSGAAPWTSRTRWLTVYERQPDGSWLVVRESYDLLR